MIPVKRIYVSKMGNSVDPDQLASQKPADLHLHCFQNTWIIFGLNIEKFAHFSAKHLIESDLMGEKSHSRM